MDAVAPTICPSMDIQISANFERLLFESAGRDAGAVIRMMDGLKQSGGFAVPDNALAAIRRDFAAGTTGEAETRATMATMPKASGYLLDPHTAVVVPVAQAYLGAPPMVTLAPPHPANFPPRSEARPG